MSSEEQLKVEPLPTEDAADVKGDSKAAVNKISVSKANAPFNKFSGGGVTFRAKLFGTADVKEARGDAICATAMNLLKAAVKSTGEHKQKIIIKINLSGIVLVDAVSQVKLYEHPVNKISFIAKDPADNRAFGYIVADKENSHMYFAIKTEKAAEQVVTALKELFQTVFEMKKKEAEMKGESIEKPAAGAEAKSPAAASMKDDADGSKKQDSMEPSLGEETQSKPTESSEVKRQDSQSHLLDLIENLTFDTPATTSSSQPFAAQQNGNTWNQPSSAWGGQASSQSDPFAVQTSIFSQQQQTQSPFSQPNAFNQPSQPSPFQSNFNQPMTSYNSNFGQPQQQQTAFSNSPFAPQQQTPQQSMFGTQSPFSSAPMSMYNQQPNMNTSPFATHTSMTTNQPSMFGNDPFNTSSYQHMPQQSQPAVASSNNPFAAPSGGDQSFGVLQPQQMQPTPAPRGNVQPHLFSDLNPLPTSTGLRKDQFFNDVKNPPKPKLNELAPQKSQQTPPVDNSNVSALLNDFLTITDSSINSNDYNYPSTCSTNSDLMESDFNVIKSLFVDAHNSQPFQQSVVNNPDLDWLNQLDSGTSTQSSSTNQSAQNNSNSQKQGLLPPPPSSLRQRQQQGPAPVVRPR